VATSSGGKSYAPVLGTARMTGRYRYGSWAARRTGSSSILSAMTTRSNVGITSKTFSESEDITNRGRISGQHQRRQQMIAGTPVSPSSYGRAHHHWRPAESPWPISWAGVLSPLATSWTAAGCDSMPEMPSHCRGRAAAAPCRPGGPGRYPYRRAPGRSAGIHQAGRHRQGGLARRRPPNAWTSRQRSLQAGCR
jgi:hypothetical protein